MAALQDGTQVEEVGGTPLSLRSLRRVRMRGVVAAYDDDLKFVIANGSLDAMWCGRCRVAVSRA